MPELPEKSLQQVKKHVRENIMHQIDIVMRRRGLNADDLPFDTTMLKGNLNITVEDYIDLFFELQLELRVHSTKIKRRFEL